MKHTVSFLKTTTINMYKFTSNIKDIKSDSVLKKKLNLIVQQVKYLPYTVASTLFTRILKFTFVYDAQRKREALKEMLYWFIFIIAAKMAGGGTDLDFEGGIADFDMKLFGIGFHRHVFFHSILIGFGVEFIFRFIGYFIQAIYLHLPDDHLRVWDNVNDIYTSVENGVISGTWMGLAIHLFADSNLIYGLDARVKPVVGLPAMSDDSHQLFLGLNAAMSGLFAAGFPDEFYGEGE